MHSNNLLKRLNHLRQQSSKKILNKLTLLLFHMKKF